MDSPVGLYNIPQQRTSQAFSSMDDLDAMVVAQKQLSGKIRAFMRFWTNDFDCDFMKLTINYQEQ